LSSLYIRLYKHYILGASTILESSLKVPGGVCLEDARTIRAGQIIGFDAKVVLKFYKSLEVYPIS
jgi:hypothetical protein